MHILEQHVTVSGRPPVPPPVEVQRLRQQHQHPPQRLVLEDDVDALIAHLAPFKDQLDSRLRAQPRQHILQRLYPDSETDLLLQARVGGEPCFQPSPPGVLRGRVLSSSDVACREQHEPCQEDQGLTARANGKAGRIAEQEGSGCSRPRAARRRFEGRVDRYGTRGGSRALCVRSSELQAAPFGLVHRGFSFE